MATVKKYFVAIIPPEPFYGICHDLKLQLAEKYNTKGSLKSPPHCTLYMPFYYREEKENELQFLLQEICKNQNKFNLAIDGFGFFTPRVVYIKTNCNDELMRFQKIVSTKYKSLLHSDTSDYKNQGFTPHFTIAFRDLKKEMFKNAYIEFKDIEIKHQFEVNEICLLKHDGTEWKKHFEEQFKLAVQ